MTMETPKKRTLAAVCPWGPPCIMKRRKESVSLRMTLTVAGGDTPRPPLAGVIKLRSDGTPASSVSVLIGLGISRTTSELSLPRW